jgi:hypothetical protein
MAPKSDHRKIKWLEIVTSRISTKKLNKLKRSFADVPHTCAKTSPCA